MQHMDDADHTGRIITEGRKLMWAIEALNQIESSRPFEREMAELLRAAYRRCLRDIVAAAPPWVSEEILTNWDQSRYTPPLIQPEQRSAPAPPAPPDLAADADHTTTAPEVHQVTDGVSEVPDDSRDQDDEPGPVLRGSKRYQTPTLTKRERNRGIRSLPI